MSPRLAQPNHAAILQAVEDLTARVTTLADNHREDVQLVFGAIDKVKDEVGDLRADLAHVKGEREAEHRVHPVMVSPPAVSAASDGKSFLHKTGIVVGLLAGAVAFFSGLQAAYQVAWGLAHAAHAYLSAKPH